MGPPAPEITGTQAQEIELPELQEPKSAPEPQEPRPAHIERRQSVQALPDVVELDPDAFAAEYHIVTSGPIAWVQTNVLRDSSRGAFALLGVIFLSVTRQALTTTAFLL